MAGADVGGGAAAVARRDRAVILAAGRGVRLRPATDESPKPLVSVAGRSILARQAELLEAIGVREAMVVTGYRGDAIERAVAGLASGLRFGFLHNGEWESTNNAVSLALAADFLADGGYVVEGDGVFRAAAARPIRAAAARLRGDLLWVAARLAGPVDGCVIETDPASRLTGVRIVAPGTLAPGREILKSAGMLVLSAGGAATLFELLSTHRDAYRTKYYDLVIADHLDRWDASVCPISGSDWAEVDTMDDLRRAEELFR